MKQSEWPGRAAPIRDCVSGLAAAGIMSPGAWKARHRTCLPCFRRADLGL